MPVASAAAEPPLEPPAVNARFQGLRVARKTLSTVFGPNANSGVLVLPITIAPASRRRCFAADLAASHASDDRGADHPAAVGRHHADDRHPVSHAETGVLVLRDADEID